MINSIILKSAALAGRNALAVHKRTVVTSAPLVRMNVYKKFAIGGTMVCSSLIIPAYVLVNLKYYNKSAYATEEDEEE